MLNEPVVRDDPDRNLGFLLIEVTRLLRKDFERRARTHALPLTQIQWRAIANLARCEGITQVVLAERLEIKPITLTRLIDRLASAGWVERRPDPTDRRAVRLYLTQRAQPLLEQMHVHAAATRDTALAGLSARARQDLLAKLTHMKSNLLEAHDQESAATEYAAVESRKAGSTRSRRSKTGARQRSTK